MKILGGFVHADGHLRNQARQVQGDAGFQTLRTTQLCGYTKLAGSSKMRHGCSESACAKQETVPATTLDSMATRVAAETNEQTSTYSRAVVTSLMAVRTFRAKASRKADRSKKYVTCQVTHDTFASHVNIVRTKIDVLSHTLGCRFS